MYQLLNILVFLLLITTIAFIGLFRSNTIHRRTSRILRKAQNAPWNLVEFTRLHPSQWNRREYYRFTEEPVRSFAHRYNGRFDTAILHWEEAAVLDLMIEYKFPVRYLPKKMKEEDYFQTGLYSLALAESGISCSSTKLVTVYCLQDVAKRCIHDKLKRNCWHCEHGRVFEKRFNPDTIQKHLKMLDEVWYKKRLPKATPSETKCKPCSFSKSGDCNYSVI
ncbi:MAG: hypothetical protein ACFFCT_06870 [Candidatus Odinarchaeota archaeon]